MKSTKVFIICLLAMVAIFSCKPEEVIKEVAGNITYTTSTGEVLPLEGATVELYSDEERTNKVYSATTILDGTYSITPVEEGHYYGKVTYSSATLNFISEDKEIKVYNHVEVTSMHVSF